MSVDLLAYEEVVSTVKGLSPLSMDQACSVEHLKRVATYCEPWRLVGETLGVSQTRLDTIERENRTVEERKMGVLLAWSQSRASRATYRKVIEALLDCGQVDQAIEACRQLGRLLVISKEPVVVPPPPAQVAPPSNLPQERQPPDGSIEREVRQLEEDYRKICMNLLEDFKENGTTVDHLRRFAATIPISIKRWYYDLAFPTHPSPMLKPVMTLSEFIDAMNIFSHALSPALLGNCVKMRGSASTKALMAAHEAKLEEWLRATKVWDFVETWEGATTPEVLEEIEERVGAGWQEKSMKAIFPHKRTWLVRRVMGV